MAVEDVAGYSALVNSSGATARLDTRTGVSGSCGLGRVLSAQLRSTEEVSDHSGGVKTKGVWNEVVPSGIAGNLQSRICESAHDASRSEPTVFCTTLASITSPEAATEIATTSLPFSPALRVSSYPYQYWQ